MKLISFFSLVACQFLCVILIQDAANLLRSVSDKKVQHVTYRDQRPSLLAEDVTFVPSDDASVSLSRRPCCSSEIDYRISLIISRTFLDETSHPENGVRLTIEMRLTFGIFVKLTVRHAYAYAVYMKSQMRVSPYLVEGNF